MVEVLERGNKTIVNCTLCGAKLRYAKGDIKQEEIFRRQRDSYFQKYIICPDCGEKVTIKQREEKWID